jgi:high-affinity iron transporter
MLSTAIIIFREVLEIAMILGVVLAATRGLRGRLYWIIGGFAAGIAGASIVALFAKTISEAASGMGQEFFNAMILFTAALVIGWTALWMRNHAREMVTHFRAVGKDVIEGKLPGISLSVVIGLALLREGSEIVLFIYGMVLSGQSTSSIILGSTIGIFLGIIAGTLLYLGLIKMSAKHMLTVTGWLLILLVAGLSLQGAGYLSAAGYFDNLSTPLWNTSWLLSDDDIIGKALHSLIGYTAKPTLIQILFYVSTMALLLGLIKLTSKHPKPINTSPSQLQG